MFLLRGLSALLFGILAFVWPGLTLTVLVLLFGAYALVDGCFAVVSAIANARREPRWWALLLEGIVGILAGIFTFLNPARTALALLYLIAAWAIVTGILEVVTAIQQRREVTGEWLLIMSGIASVIFGILLVVVPGAGVLTLVWLIASAIVFGLLLIVLAVRLRGLGRTAAGGARRTA